MANLSSEYCVKLAKELTVIAMENGLIIKDADSKVTAQNVIDFFQTIVKKINTEQ